MKLENADNDPGFLEKMNEAREKDKKETEEIEEYLKQF